MDAMTMGEQENFLKPLLDMMNKRMDEISSKLDDNTAISQQALDEARSAHGKIETAEAAIRRLERTKGRKLDLPPNVIYLIALGAVILLLVIATLLHINIGGITR
jgi:hypothetical protein